MSDHNLDALLAPLEAVLDLSDSALAMERQAVSRSRVAPSDPATAVSFSLDTSSTSYEVQPKSKATLASRITRTQPPTSPTLPIHNQVRSAALPVRKRKVCHLYKQGKCYIGTSCKDLHEPTAPRLAGARARQLSQRDTFSRSVGAFTLEAHPFDRKRKRSNPNDRDVFAQRAPVSSLRSNAFPSLYEYSPRAAAAAAAPAFPAAPVAMRGRPATKSYTMGAQQPPLDSFVQRRQVWAPVEAQHTQIEDRNAGREGDRRVLHRRGKRMQRMKANHKRRKEEKVAAGGLDYGDEV
jgi:hypothetical protein